jgi:hypothetical protein
LDDALNHAALGVSGLGHARNRITASAAVAAASERPKVRTPMGFRARSRFSR